MVRIIVITQAKYFSQRGLTNLPIKRLSLVNKVNGIIEIGKATLKKLEYITIGPLQHSHFRRIR